MSNQQSMFSPEHSSHRQQQEHLYNDDPREQYTQPLYQERASGEGSYEEGYQGYIPPYMQGEKLRPAPPPALPGWKIVLIILIIALVVTGGGALGSLINVIVGILGGSFGLVVAACIVLAAISTRPVPLPTRTFAVEAHADLSIHNDAGNVRILRGESHQVEVRGTRYVSKLFGESGEVPIFSTQEGHSISLNVKHWSFLRFFNIGYVNLDIHVPASSDIQIRCNAGTLDISGISGHVNARTNAGTVMVASSQLTDGSFLHTNAGTITIRRSILNGRMRGHTDAGTISIVESTLQGNAAFTTNAGTIHFDGELSPDSDSLFKTNAGTIDAILPSDSSFALTAHTSLGNVRNDFQGNLVGHGPYARLNLESQLGTISVGRK
jgi:putative adhesin